MIRLSKVYDYIRAWQAMGVVAVRPWAIWCDLRITSHAEKCRIGKFLKQRMGVTKQSGWYVLVNSAVEVDNENPMLYCE